MPKNEKPQPITKPDFLKVLKQVSRKVKPNPGKN